MRFTWNPAPPRPFGSAAAFLSRGPASRTENKKPESRPPWRRTAFHVAQLVLVVCLPLASFATESGTTAFPNGVEDFLVASMPPPGWYGTLYYNNYDADRVADNDGNMALESFQLDVNAVTSRIDWVKPVSILGADRWGTLLLVPWVDLDLSLSPAPGVVLRGSKSGMGDLTLGNGLHWTFPGFEMVNAIDVGVPTGAYDASDLANPGLNRWVIRLNHMGTWRPAPDWEVSYRLHTDFNFRNPATGYSSGETVYLNWAAGWKPAPPATIGLAGYVLRQVTDDRLDGRVVGPDGNKVSVDGIGPCLKYMFPSHVIVAAKYFHEFDVRNHPIGNQLWLYVIVPLGPPPGTH